MANKFDYLFENTPGAETQSLRGMANTIAKAEAKTVFAGEKQYLAHIQKVQEKTLFEGLEALRLKEITSTGGYPAFRIGEGPQTLARNTISAINAVLSVAAAKYKILDVGYHESWHNPKTRSDGIITAWDGDQWVVYDWENGKELKSKVIVPGQPGIAWTNGNRRYHYQSQKHQAIKDFLLTVKYETSWLVVMNNENELAHFQRVIRDRLEMPLYDPRDDDPELVKANNGEAFGVWGAISKDWSRASTRNSLTRGRGSGNSVEPSAERQSFVAELAKLDTDATIFYRDHTSTVEQPLFFKASDPVRKAKSMNLILAASPSVEYVRYEKVES